MKEEPPPEKVDSHWAHALAEVLREDALAKSRPPRLRRLWLFVGGLGVVAGLAVAIIQLVQWANARPSSVTSLVMETGDLGTTVAQYAVPINAPFADFPTILEPSPDVPSAQTCSKDQLRWLDRYGKRFAQRLYVQMRNTAESGTLSVRDFRAEGQLKRQRTPLVPIYCVLPIGSAVNKQEGTIPLDNRSIATWEEPEIRFGQPNGPFAGGTPVAYDLAAGESALLFLNTENRDDFEGVLKATVQAGNKETVVTVPVNDSDQSATNEQIFIPKFTLGPDFYIYIGGSSDAELAAPFTWGYNTRERETSTRGTLPELITVLKDLR